MGEDGDDRRRLARPIRPASARRAPALERIPDERAREKLRQIAAPFARRERGRSDACERDPRERVTERASAPEHEPPDVREDHDRVEPARGVRRETIGPRSEHARDTLAREGSGGPCREDEERRLAPVEVRPEPAPRAPRLDQRAAGEGDEGEGRVAPRGDIERREREHPDPADREERIEIERVPRHEPRKERCDEPAHGGEQEEDERRAAERATRRAGRQIEGRAHCER